MSRSFLTVLPNARRAPAPEVEVQTYELDGKKLLVLTVSRGADPPYGITMPKNDKPAEFTSGGTSPRSQPGPMRSGTPS